MPTKGPPTPNYEPVFAALRKNAKPLTACQILDWPWSRGVSAPPAVYWALVRLMEDGHAHRLESLNAFVTCTHPRTGIRSIQLEHRSRVPGDRRILDPYAAAHKRDL
ncbi:MAG TPA: hypothetical protein VMF67_08455 [Rhizomicrobium sp.]|nr:hypothetical protein [Rhizomicrobium sp.]